MAKDVNLTIDGQKITVPAGTLIVDAAKMNGIKIPTFCYHPKLDPVGSCRMCMVEIGRPMIDRATGQPILEEDGSPKIAMMPKLDTSCTTPVSEGMVVITDSDKVADSRRAMLEFLLTSHPLDCPVCDKGGECPLQNQTLKYGADNSRFELDDKCRLEKHYPLGDLIYLDRERCVLCGRCIRFVHQLAGDPVLDFYQRGRQMQIISTSKPAFDSIFSGNTTDICPVGALTTADFRFGARPWELNMSAAICNRCPVHCNMTLNTRREAKSNGRSVIKRVMPRQNEEVNEIWICDKGRFGYHYNDSPLRLKKPHIRKEGVLQEVEWDEALEFLRNGIQFQSVSMLSVATGRLSNEDLFNMMALTRERAGKAVLYTNMAGGEVTAELGLPAGSNLGKLGKGDVVVVMASDLHQEAPIWWLRLREAVKRGAKVIQLNARTNRMEPFAAFDFRYEYGKEMEALEELLGNGTNKDEHYQAAAQALAEAENVVIFYGSDGMALRETSQIARYLGAWLKANERFGKVNNGLVAVWQSGNSQGAWELGYRPSLNLAKDISEARVVLVAGADLAGDCIEFHEALEKVPFLVVNEMFMTETAKLAQVVLPVQSPFETEGTYVSGERRVQRFYQATDIMPDCKADFSIFAIMANMMDIPLEEDSARLIFEQLCMEVPAFSGLTYQKISETPKQWPDVGRSNLYYGGTGYENTSGVGVVLNPVTTEWLNYDSVDEKGFNTESGLRVVPITRLYDHGILISHSELLDEHLIPSAILIHPDTAAEHKLEQSKVITIYQGCDAHQVLVVLDPMVPQGVALKPRNLTSVAGARI